MNQSFPSMHVKATYTVKVYVDADGDMVIVQNPTLAPAVEKSDYEPKTPEADASVDADTVNDATAFLETFFKLYPTATEKELLPIHHQGHEYQCHILKRLYNLFRSRPKQPFYQQGHLAIR